MAGQTASPNHQPLVFANGMASGDTVTLSMAYEVDLTPTPDIYFLQSTNYNYQLENFLFPFGRTNPFHPGYGELPPVMAGRDRLKRDLKIRMKAVKVKKTRPTAITLTGPRGCGKTALLKWIAGEARESNMPVVTMASENLSSVEAIARGMARKFPRNLLERVSGIKLNVGDFGAGFDLAEVSRVAGAEDMSSWLEALGSGNTGGVLLLDEAHNMPPEVGHIFYNAAQTVGKDYPLLLVIAGTPDLPSVLARSGATFIERGRMERIGRLDRDDTRQALFKPFGRWVRFNDDAMEHVLDEVQDYPYFIQLWRSALWDTLARNRTFRPGMDMVDAARKTVDEQRLELYNRRVEELDNSRLLVPFAEMAWRVGEGGQPTSRDFNLALQHLSPHQGFDDREQLEVRQKLLHTGFVWEPLVGIWEYGIPSLASYVRRNAVDFLLERLEEQGLVEALQTIAKCFGPPQRQPMVKARIDLDKALTLNKSGYDPLASFLAMKLLGPVQDSGQIRLRAPHLVRATVTEAIRRELLTKPEPDEETEFSPPTSSFEPRM